MSLEKLAIYSYRLSPRRTFSSAAAALLPGLRRRSAVPNPPKRPNPSPILASLLAVLALALISGCGDDSPLSLKLVPAHLASTDAQAPAGWTETSFGGNNRAAAGTYHIAPEPLLTEWNIIAAKSNAAENNTHTVAVRLNAYAVRQLEKFCADPANLKAPLVLLLDGQAVDVFPLLRPPGDRLLLYGFSTRQTQRLEEYLKNK